MTGSPWKIRVDTKTKPVASQQPDLEIAIDPKKIIRKKDGKYVDGGSEEIEKGANACCGHHTYQLRVKLWRMSRTGRVLCYTICTDSSIDRAVTWHPSRAY
uniref:Uncharacterized protein n=1 Tax=Vespula pensylvanica TaxID=30213 RepID=A0A834K8N0_VESPE|nr:hypothetical protein H0235_015241 [Vespula pensylvanica]